MADRDIDFETERLLLVRAFDVTKTDKSIERVFAHMHDGGQHPAGHLSFITIDRNGHSKISRVINAREWSDVVEVASEITPEEKTFQTRAKESVQPTEIRRRRGIH